MKPMENVKTRKVNVYEEANRCLLCQDAPCTQAYKTGDPARAIRAMANNLRNSSSGTGS